MALELPKLYSCPWCYQKENSEGNVGQKKDVAKQNATKVVKGVEKQNSNIKVKKREVPTSKKVVESSKKITE